MPQSPTPLTPPTADAEPLFSFRGLGLSYRAKPALRGINWDWIPGQHWAILGPNGAGKTTLASILTGEQKHYSGDYIPSERLRRGGVAYVCFERGALLCERDRKRDCAEYESSASDTGTRVRELLPLSGDNEQAWQTLVDMLELGSILDRGLRYISTGEMRKTLLASALLSEPELLILDSPLDGLDKATQARLASSLSTIIQSSQAVMLLCRSAEDVPEGCTHLMLLDRGRTVAQGERLPLLNSEVVSRVLRAPAIQFSPPPTRASAPVPQDDTATLELRNVSVSFGEHCVFKDLNWRLDRHQHCLIAGPNGSGKSTLLDLLTGDNHKAYGQQVDLFGRRRGTGESVWDIKARFGRVDSRMQFQVPNGSKVEGVVLSGFFSSLGLHDRPSDQQRSQAKRWLQSLGLAALAGEEFHTLSFGIQRLVLLARAMVKDPVILLLDEATISLDAGHRRLLLDAVDHVVAEGRCQLLFVSHTAGERPLCINQILNFIPAEGGSTVAIESSA